MNDYVRTREDWLEEAASLIIDELLTPTMQPRKSMRLKFSMAPPPGTVAGSRNVAACKPSSESKGGENLIYISDVLSDQIEILGHLIHELCHAMVDCENGHKGMFAHLARGAGLEGQLQSTYIAEGTDLHAYALEIIEILGDIPHKPAKVQQPKEPSRSVKLVCYNDYDDEPCGFRCQTSSLQVTKIQDRFGVITCPACGGDMNVEFYKTKSN